MRILHGGTVKAWAAQHPDVAESLTAWLKNASHATWRNLAKVRQEAYAANHGGRYWQGIATPSNLPDDGALVAADYTKKPHDQAERWTDIFFGADVLPTNIPAQAQVDVYDGPQGKGWTVTLRGTKNGNLYWRTWNVGPETWREQDWQSCILPCSIP